MNLVSNDNKIIFEKTDEKNKNSRKILFYLLKFKKKKLYF